MSESFTIVIVGFKVDEENSVHYQKIRDANPEKIGLSLWKAYEKGADFVSVRFIREETER
jgi:hypothetical protein